MSVGNGVPALVMDRVSKRFRKGEHDSLRDLLPAIFAKVLRGGEAPALRQDEFWALKDISLEIQRGEAFGIIGHNGAGKSTILKILSRILRPTSGSMIVRGRLSALIEISAGFHPDLTGRENIYLNGTILGMTREEVRRKFDEIVAFSGLEEFIDTPVKRYSSGMFARLGFSVAAHVDPDILIVDEVLSVGDFVFQRRCLDKMAAVLRSGVTVVFVSHDLRAVADLCSRAALLERGRVVRVGASQEVVRDYLDAAASKDRRTEGKDVHVSRVQVEGGEPGKATFRSGDTIRVHCEVEALTDVAKLALILEIRSQDGYCAFNTSTERLGVAPFSLSAGQKFRCTVDLDLHLAAGKFDIATYLYRYDIQREYDRWYPAATFFVSTIHDVRGIANLNPRLLVEGD